MTLIPLAFVLLPTSYLTVVKKLPTSPLGLMATRSLWFPLLPLGQLFIEAKLLGVRVTKLVPVMCCVMLLTHGPRLWPLRIIIIVGSPFAVRVGCI